MKSYRFRRDDDENSWDAIRRLAEEVGWTVTATPDEMLKLLVAHGKRSASRAEMTREDFVRLLVQEVNARIVVHQPKEIA